MNITIKIDDSKPRLKQAMQSDPAKAKAVIGTFVQMMEDALAYGWADLPEKFHPDLTFQKLIHDILHGILDLKDIDPSFYDDLGVMIHPFGLMSYSLPDMTNPEAAHYWDWQRHYDWQDTKGGLPPIQSFLRKLMYYARYLDIEALGKAMFRKDMDVYMSERDLAPLIAAHPAIQYQRRKLGERFAGKIHDGLGTFECGELPPFSSSCPACTIGELKFIANRHVCKRCGAGYS